MASNGIMDGQVEKLTLWTKAEPGQSHRNASLGNRGLRPIPAGPLRHGYNTPAVQLTLVKATIPKVANTGHLADGRLIGHQRLD